MIKTKWKWFRSFSPFNHLQNLKSLYPNLTEIIAREQFYRQNNLPVEINYLIEEYCLDLDNLNGDNSIVWRVDNQFKTDFHSYVNAIIRSQKLKALNPLITREIELNILTWVERLRNTIEQYEKDFQTEWITDKRNYFKHRKLVFDLFQTKENERLLSLALQKTSLEVTESIESNIIHQID